MKNVMRSLFLVLAIFALTLAVTSCGKVPSNVRTEAIERFGGPSVAAWVGFKLGYNNIYPTTMDESKLQYTIVNEWSEYDEDIQVQKHYIRFGIDHDSIVLSNGVKLKDTPKAEQIYDRMKNFQAVVFAYKQGSQWRIGLSRKYEPEIVD